MCHERPPIPLPRCDTVPLTGATVGVPRGESMSTPLWARPPERAAPQVLLKATGPCTGHTNEPVAIGVDGADETGARPAEPPPDPLLRGPLARTRAEAPAPRTRPLHPPSRPSPPTTSRHPH